MNKNKSYYLGKKYNRLTVISIAGKDKSGNIKVFCRCDCGNFKTVRLVELTNNKTKSCGCLRKERARIHFKKDIFFFNDIKVEQGNLLILQGKTKVYEKVKKI